MVGVLLADSLPFIAQETSEAEMPMKKRRKSKPSLAGKYLKKLHEKRMANAKLKDAKLQAAGMLASDETPRSIVRLSWQQLRSRGVFDCVDAAEVMKVSEDDVEAVEVLVRLRTEAPTNQTT